jgi:hypothetical protein
MGRSLGTHLWSTAVEAQFSRVLLEAETMMQTFNFLDNGAVAPNLVARSCDEESTAS